MQTNLSAFLDGLIRSTSDDSPEIIAIKIEQISKDLAKTEDAANTLRAQRDMMQAKLNLFKTNTDSTDIARRSLLRRYVEYCSRDRLKGPMYLAGWLDGPANAHMVKEAGFATAQEAVAWCQGQERRA